MPRRTHRLAGVAAAALAAVAAAAPSASAEDLLQERLTSATKSARVCHDRLAPGGRGVRTERVRLARSSVVTARLAGRSGDWDVAVFDAGTRRLVAASAGLNSVEVAQGYAGRGTLVVQACRRKGAGAVDLTVSALPLRGGTGKADIKVLEVFTPTRAHKAALTALDLDVTEHAGHDYVEVVTYGPKDVDRLRQAGFTWKVSIADLAAYSRRIARENLRYSQRTSVSGLPSGRDSYRRLADYEAEMKELVEDNPDLVRPFVLPHRTMEGREVFGIEVAKDVQASDGRPTFAMMGLHHAREWPSGEHTIEFAYDLVKGFGTDARITDLVTRVRSVFVPVVNADGFNVSREHLGAPDVALNTATGLADPAGEFRRRNCRLFGAALTPGEIAQPDRSAPGACMLPSSRLLGVDPNRNYGALWGGPGASALPVYDTYRGSGPFSEPETQNVRWLVSNRQVTTLITNHTYSNLILRAPGVKAQGIPVDEERMAALGARMAAQNGYTNQPSWALYDTTGTTEDWSYNATGGYGYTFEIGENTFHPAFFKAVAEYVGHGGYEGKGNRAAYLIALENAADAAHHSVLTGAAKAGTVLKIGKTFETKTSNVGAAPTGLVDCGPSSAVTGRETGVQTFTDTLVSRMEARNGRFEWHVNPSTRPVVQEKREVLAEDVKSWKWKREVDPADPSLTAISHHDHELEIGAGDSADYLGIALDWELADGTGTSPEDYDLEVYRIGEDGKETKVGSAGDWPGCAEYTEIPFPGAGRYVIRVINFAAAGQRYELSATLKDEVGYRTIQPAGEPESYELTCETKDGEVIGRRRVVVGRGERLNLGQVCRKT